MCAINKWSIKQTPKNVEIFLLKIVRKNVKKIYKNDFWSQCPGLFPQKKNMLHIVSWTGRREKK